MAKGQQLSLHVPSHQLDAIDAFFQEQGLVEWSLKSKNGTKSLSGRTRNGATVGLSFYSANGYQERTASMCKRLTPAKRRLEAKRLYNKEGLTQVEIATKLGCSQKTISNDLNS